MAQPQAFQRQKGRFGNKGGAVDDLVLLDQIKEDKILECLKLRYQQDLIYTSIGPVLIAINPFKMIPQLYTDARIREYKGKNPFELPPHVYALANDAYSSMINYRENQCVIISGESGSGKTETSKIIMQFISGVSGKTEEVVRVKERMLSSNPVLEAFGNAKTVNNNNSSRFGKYMEILFNFGGDPVGGRVTNYLLEKSRVVGPAVGERNFHVFYQITKSSGQQDRQKFCIENPDYYYYLSCSECFDVNGIDDVADFKEMQEALQTIGIREEERQEISRVVSAVLWLGNIAFTEDKTEKSSVQDKQVVDIASGLLGVQAKSLAECLTTRQIQTGVGAKAEIFKKPNTAAESDFNRDTLSKALYSRMFDWLVHKINISIHVQDFKGVHIGVLDIYGFEIFEYNSFEQLCINFVNERLQQIFIELTLKAEQEEYRQEGIPWTDIDYYNNLPLCQLIEDKPGLITICDDACNTGKTDQMFVQDLGRFFGTNPALHCGSNDFTIRHFAGDVRYESIGFLTKNKDTLFDDLVLVIQSSKHLYAKDHGWAALEISTGQKKKPPTVGSQFKVQVTLLMTALKACVPHYIRCIKPNNTKQPNDMNPDNLKRQVRYLGLLENVRVRRAGYAHRSLFARFVKRYGLLSSEVWRNPKGDPRRLCEQLCTSIGWRQGQQFAMGKTKIFIQAADVLFQLEDMLDRKMNDSVIAIQKAYRAYKQKRYFLVCRADAYDLLNGRKERRRGSVNREYQGDYLDFTYNQIVAGLLQLVGAKERILFADRGKVVQLRGKQNIFARMFSGKPKDIAQVRFIMLSDKALYSFAFEIDPETDKTKAKLFFRVPTLQIQSVVMSPYADNYMVVHFAEAANVRDILQWCRRKTEFVAVLYGSSKEQGHAIQPQFTTQDQICVNAKSKKFCEIKWVKDEMVPQNTDTAKLVKHNVEIHAPTGVPPSQVQAPYRPAEFDANVNYRPSLKALYDCKGNGVDELDFRAGDIIFIVKDVVDGWYEGELNGKIGFVPATYVEKQQRQLIKKGANSPKAAGGGRGGGYMGGGGGGGGGGPPMMGGGGGGGRGGGAPMGGGGGGGGGGRGGGGGFVPPMPAMMGGGRGGGGGGGGPPSGGGGPGGGGRSVKKSDWEELTNEEGEVYFFNAKTNVSQWEKPQELVMMENKGGGRYGGGGGGGGGNEKKSTPVQQQGPKCKQAGCNNKPFAGKEYCVSHVPKAAVPAAKPAAAKKKSPWVKLKDDASGDDYYYNESTGQTTWDRPADF